jgi:hypothetical protein
VAHHGRYWEILGTGWGVRSSRWQVWRWLSSELLGHFVWMTVTDVRRQLSTTETSVNFYKTTWRNYPEKDRLLPGNTFTGDRAGIRGPVEWTSRSPGLIPPDFVICSLVKTRLDSEITCLYLSLHVTVVILFRTGLQTWAVTSGHALYTADCALNAGLPVLTYVERIFGKIWMKHFTVGHTHFMPKRYNAGLSPLGMLFCAPTLALLCQWPIRL